MTSSGSINDLRLVIEGKITELGREPCNVQVLFEEHTSEAAFTLLDDSGEFLTVSAVETELPMLLEDGEVNSDPENESSAGEIVSLRLSVATITTERDALLRELQSVKQELELKKARVKELWRMNCEQLSEYDSLLVAKEEEIARLTVQLAEQHNRRPPTDENDDADSISEPQIRESGCGRAPPVDKFTGEDPSVRLDDWLPGLNRASRWNGWSAEEKLIQLAGHLRGRAEAEWNLLADEDVCDFDTVLKNVWTPTSESNETHHDTDEDSLDPLSLLYSDFEGTVDTVRVSDKGSRPQYVNVEIQGVPTSGVIDTGADITIIGGGLFKKVATAARLRKKDFKKSDRIPRTYDRKPFELHGRMDLEISFDGKSLRTPIYIKMDAHDQLLLAEGVCSQLGIVEYHKGVWPGRKIVMEAVQAQELESKDASILSVRQVRILRETTIPAGKAVTIPVTIDGIRPQNGPLLLENFLMTWRVLD